MSIGDYRLAVGLIHANWQGLYEWIPNANTFTVFTVAPTTTTSYLGGALKFDGVNDYVDTKNWDIEENYCPSNAPASGVPSTILKTLSKS